MAKIDELIAERKRIEALHAGMPDYPSLDIDGSLIAHTNGNGHIKLNGERPISTAYGLKLAAWINEWYSDPTPPPPDAATLRKAEMFEELVATVEQCRAQIDSLTVNRGNPIFGVIDSTLAKAKAAKA